MKGIEPSTTAWKAVVLPLNYTRIYEDLSIPVVGVEPTLQKEHDFESCASANSATPARRMEAATGFEPMIKVLQTSALPLGYAALETGLAGFEPTNDGVKVRCLTAWL